MNQRIVAMGREEFWKLAVFARTKGLDLAEVLDREGVLLTPARMTAVRVRAIEDAATFLESLTTAQLTGRTIGVTANDAHRAAVALLRDIVHEGWTA